MARASFASIQAAVAASRTQQDPDRGVPASHRNLSPNTPAPDPSKCDGFLTLVPLAMVMNLSLAMAAPCFTENESKTLCSLSLLQQTDDCKQGLGCSSSTFPAFPGQPAMGTPIPRLLRGGRAKLSYPGQLLAQRKHHKQVSKTLQISYPGPKQLPSVPGKGMSDARGAQRSGAKLHFLKP